MDKRRLPLIACVLLLSVAVGILCSTRVSAAAAPSLFHRDEVWYRDSSAGLEIIDGVFYVPVDIFGAFSQIELSMDSPRGEFMVYNRTTRQYISVLFREKIATVNGEEEIYLNLYKLHGGYYYVPAEYFCSVLSLSCTVTPSSNENYGVSLRIGDGSETKTFEELLSPYSAAALPTESDTESSAPPVTEPPVTSDEDTAPREIYLTFNTVEPRAAEQILEQLAASGVHATFFFTQTELESMQETAIAVAAAGHAIGLCVADAQSETELLLGMERANEYLYALLKMKTRIVQLRAGTERSGFSGEQLSRIGSEGYVLWDWTYDVPDSVGYSAAFAAALTVNAVRAETVSVLRMGCNATTVQLLDTLLDFIGKHPMYETKPIRVCTPEIRFVSDGKES